jgi:uncharacterized membrane protein YeaQ/YmgE (transglycosylase-associated protein family)
VFSGIRERPGEYSHASAAPTYTSAPVLGALILGLFAGYIGRALTPGRGPKGCLVTELLGLAGAALGYFLFTEVLDIGDARIFDLGGLPGAVAGVIIILLAYRAVTRRVERRRR